MKDNTAQKIAEHLFSWMESLPQEGWVHGGDFLPANVLCDMAGQRGFINGMAREINKVIES